MAAPVYGLVLAGGQSRRMQQDKALLEYHGRPQYLHTYRLLKKVCQQVFLSCRPGQLHKFQEQSPDLPIITDQHEDIGPLAALLSAFQQEKAVAWLTLACDMPLMDTATLKFLIKHRDPSAVATTYQLSGQDFPETMCTLWEPAAFLLLEEARKRGRYSLTRFLKQHPTKLVHPSDANALTNINTDEERKGVKNKTKQ